MSRKKKLSFNSNFEGNGPEDFRLKIEDWRLKKASFDPFDRLRAGRLRTGRAWSILRQAQDRQAQDK
jgi:hypothetical protein